MTLRKLRVWMFDPIMRLKILAALVDVCQGMSNAKALCDFN